jgi:hypothetical protein
MSKEYILTACEPIPDSVVGLKGHPMALNIPYPRYKQITLTKEELEAILNILSESTGSLEYGDNIPFSDLLSMINKLRGLINE